MVSEKTKKVVRFAAKEAAGAIPIVGPSIRRFIEGLSIEEKHKILKELKKLSESQFVELREETGVSIDYLRDIHKILIIYLEELRAITEREEVIIGREKEIAKALHLKPEIIIPTIQSVLRKGKTTEGDFFKKEPEWIDFEEGFVIERDEVDDVIAKLENYNIVLILGEPASGKSVILKNIGFKLANENREVYIVELKKHSRDDIKCYFENIGKINDEKAIFIVDDAHLNLAECERLVMYFESKGKGKLIIGSRETTEIREGHPKIASQLEYLTKSERTCSRMHAGDVTEKMIKNFLKRKYDFSDERMNTVSKNLEKYKKDLWLLSWALKAYNQDKDSVEEVEIYEKIRDSIRKIEVRKGKTQINAEDAFLALSVFYRFEIPIERDFLEEILGVKEEIINHLIKLSEIVETEEIGRNRMLSLNHSSIAGLYFRAYKMYPSLGRRVKKTILNQNDKKYIEYCFFYRYITTTDSRNAVDVVIHLERDIWDKEGRTLLSKLANDDKTQKSIVEGIEKEEDERRLDRLAMVIGHNAWFGGKGMSKLIGCIESRVGSEKLDEYCYTQE